LLRIYPFVDEYNTMLAAKMILDKGVPVMPSGLFYNHGILYSYIAALSAAVLGFSQAALRLPSLIISLPNMLLVYYVGRRWFSARAGLLAALMLALSPEAITWGGRARMYALWQFMTMASVFLLYEGTVRQPSTWKRCLGIAAFVGATLCHMRALILIPPLLLGLVLAWLITGRKAASMARLRIPWPELVTTSMGVLILLLAQRVDRPGGVASSTVLQVESLTHPARLIADVIIGAQQFLIPPYLVLTAVALAGLAALLLRVRRSHTSPADVIWAFLCFVVGATVVEFSLITPPIIRVPRYVHDLLPFFFLIVARELDFLASMIADRVPAKLQLLVHGVAFAMIIVLFLRPTVSAVTTQHHAASLALDLVGEEWRAGDKLATHLTSTAEIEFGDCDYFVALENPFLYERPDGTLTDPFLGLSWVGTQEGLREIVQDSRRLWLLVEKRYAKPYERILGEELQLVFERWDVNLYQAGGKQPLYTIYPTPELKKP
jgi:4-amino-4-deoxy-L-arabinose transferase-like glycosyltransferase